VPERGVSPSLDTLLVGGDMKNKLVGTIFIVLALILVGGLVNSCTSSTSPIVGKWQDTKGGSYFEFTRDGLVILDDGTNVVSGNYELIGDDYINVNLGGIPGNFYTLFDAHTWKFQVSGDLMTVQAGAQTLNLKRIR
jgi:hypothetical protein